MAEQLRFDFPDYPASEQIRDIEKYQQKNILKHAYLMKIDGEWAHFIIKPDGSEDYDFYHELKLPDVFYKLKEKMPDYKQHVIQNKGLEDYLRYQRDLLRKKQIDKQLLINFNNGGRND